jgi:hypothetical protein
MAPYRRQFGRLPRPLCRSTQAQQTAWLAQSSLGQGHKRVFKHFVPVVFAVFFIPMNSPFDVGLTP